MRQRLNTFGAPEPEASWRSRGACVGRDPMWWDEYGTDEQREAGAHVCADCPVLYACRDAGQHESSGVWGGQMRCGRHVVAPTSTPKSGCANGSGYKQHLDAGEYPCDQCRATMRLTITTATATTSTRRSGEEVCRRCSTPLSGCRTLYCSRECGSAARYDRQTSDVDMSVVEQLLTGKRPAKVTAAERAAAIRALTPLGRDDRDLAAWLGTNLSTITRTRRQFGIPRVGVVA